jgi:hypothetical protein
MPDQVSIHDILDEFREESLNNRDPFQIIIVIQSQSHSSTTL